MAWRNKFRLVPRWYLTLPLLLLFFELFATRFYPFSSPYFSLLLLKQPVLLTFHSLLSLLRVLSAYVFVALGIECLTRKWLRRPTLRAAIYLCLYAITVMKAFQFFPGLADYFPYISKTKWIVFLGLLLSFIVFYWEESLPIKISRATGGMFLLAIFVLSTAQSPWEGSLTNDEKSDSKRPSFLVMSFDAVPGDLFSFQNSGNFVAPLWNTKWSSKAFAFKNAYSVTNSTYTSWFSTLTGKLPADSGVLSLYPSRREGNTRPTDWYPRKFQQLGYTTAFMTDCANTSFMKHEFGFDLLFQPDKGAFKSARALVASVHPGLFPFTRMSAANWVFPELTSFSSHQYDPSLFFQAVSNTWEALESQTSPYLLIVHSCITHRDMGRHLPKTDSPLRNGLPEFPLYKSQALSDLFLSIRMADEFSNELFSKAESTKKSLWKVLTSDHGVRIDPNGSELEHFSHGIGDATNRYQYNVPLNIVPPKGELFKQDPESLVAVQDLGLFLYALSQAEASSLAYPIRKQLVLTSAVPSATPNDWGKTLLPLIRRGELKEDGTFLFNRLDDEKLSDTRSKAFLKLPYRAVWTTDSKWEIYNELSDPFNLNPIDWEKDLETTQFLSALEGNHFSSLMAN